MDQQIILTILVICPYIVAAINAARETRCKEFDVTYYEYSEFYDLSLIKDFQSENYYAKLPITFESDYGDIHVVFSESNDTINTNRAYEFALGAYGNTLCEIRRKDNVHEKRNFNGNRFADYRIPTSPTKFNVELSISSDGVVQMNDLDKNFKFNFTDQLPVIPVKYVAFAGYRGSGTIVTFDCIDVEVLHPTILPISTVVTGNVNEVVTKFDIDGTADITTEAINEIKTSTKTSFTEFSSTITKPDDRNGQANEIVPESTTVIVSSLL